MLPFTMDATLGTPFDVDDYIFIPGIRDIVEKGEESAPTQVLTSSGVKPI